MLKVPAIKMIKILAQYAQANSIKFNPRSWASVIRAYHDYVNNISPLN